MKKDLSPIPVVISSRDGKRGSVRRPQGKNSVHVGIICIKEEEYKALLDKFSPKDTHNGEHRTYDIADVPTKTGEKCLVAITRCVMQGTVNAQNAAMEMRQDLFPNFILVVGIAGGVPTLDFCLGDVIVSNHIHNLTLEDTGTDPESRRFNATGVSLHPDATRILDRLVALERGAPEPAWNTSKEIVAKRPVLKSRKTTRDADWNKKIDQALRAFNRKQPKAVVGQVASSDRVLKDPDIIKLWQWVSKGIAAVEMESAGVIHLCQRENIPFFTIRGISDIIGLQRDEAWTLYACHTAASYARMLVRSGAFCPVDGKARVVGPGPKRDSRGDNRKVFDASMAEHQSSDRSDIFKRDSEELFNKLKQEIAQALYGSSAAMDALEAAMNVEKTTGSPKERSGLLMERLIALDFVRGKDSLLVAHKHLTKKFDSNGQRVIEGVARKLIPWLYVVSLDASGLIELEWGETFSLGHILKLPAGIASFASIIMVGLDRREVYWKSKKETWPVDEQSGRLRDILYPPEGGIKDTAWVDVVQDLGKRVKVPDEAFEVSIEIQVESILIQLEQAFKEEGIRVFYLCDYSPKNVQDREAYSALRDRLQKTFPTLALVDLDQEWLTKDQRLFNKIRKLLLPEDS